MYVCMYIRFPEASRQCTLSGKSIYTKRDTNSRLFVWHFKVVSTLKFNKQPRTLISKQHAVPQKHH